MKKSYILTIALVAVLGLVLLPQIASAISIDTGIQYATATGLGTKDIRTTVASIIQVAMGLLGIIAVLIVLLGGFKWMVAGGSDEKVKEARKLIIAGVTGLIIILCAYAIANFVISSILNAT
jgi:hypothetical protein